MTSILKLPKKLASFPRSQCPDVLKSHQPRPSPTCMRFASSVMDFFLLRAIYFLQILLSMILNFSSCHRTTCHDHERGSSRSSWIMTGKEVHLQYFEVQRGEDLTLSLMVSVQGFKGETNICSLPKPL